MSDVSAFSTLFELFDLVSARSDDAPREPPARLGTTRRVFVAVTAVLLAVLMAAGWGMAANGVSAAAAMANAAKVPMLLVVSGLTSLPAVILFGKLTGARGASAGDTIVAYAVALFGGGLVLGALAPVVALYQHSSGWFGPYAALGSAVLAFAVGAALFLRVLARLSPGVRLLRLVVPAVALLVIQLATLAQMASVTDPVFGARTTFGRGVDGMVRGGAFPPAAPPVVTVEE